MQQLVNTLQFLLVILCLTIISCDNPNLNIIEPAAYPDLQEHKLGESDYYIKLPKTMFLDEARGKEGQLGYGVYLTDTSRRYISSSGFIEIEHGRPIGGGLLDEGDKLVDKIKSPLLGKNLEWKIYLNESGYFFAVAKREGVLLTASSRTHEGLDSMISIISTLKER
ncbi:MAG: hypothetical protein JNJ86_02680 [Chitinophagaceae bacterium]|nr:hypothetical protein [Chitinophagaceae bacterium]